MVNIMPSLKLPLWSMLLLSLISFFVVAYTLFSGFFKRAPIGTAITTIIVWTAFMLLILSIFHFRKSATSSPKLALVKKFYHEAWEQLWLIFPAGVDALDLLVPLLREVYDWKLDDIPRTYEEIVAVGIIYSQGNDATLFFNADNIELQCRRKLPEFEKALAKHAGNPEIPTITLVTKTIKNPNLKKTAIALRDYMLSNSIAKATLFRLEWSGDEWFWNDVTPDELVAKFTEYVEHSWSVEAKLPEDKITLEVERQRGDEIMLKITAPEAVMGELGG